MRLVNNRIIAVRPLTGNHMRHLVHQLIWMEAFNIIFKVVNPRCTAISFALTTDIEDDTNENSGN